MNSFSFLFKLDPHLTGIILNEWLDITDISRLDTAVYSFGLRKEFLMLLHFNGLVFRGLENSIGINHKKYLRWITMRNIRLRNISFPEELEDFCPEDGLLKNLAYLESANFSDCRYLTDKIFLHFLCPCKKVKQLILGSNNHFCMLTDVSLMKIGFFCPNLEHLTINDCPELLLSRCGRIKKIKLIRCRKLSNAVIKALGLYCSTLEELELDHTTISFPELTFLSHSCQSLKNLSLKNCHFLHDISPNNTEATAYFPALSSLTVSGSRVGESLLRQVISGSPSLTHLDLSSCQDIRENVFDLTRSPVSTLLSLSLHDCRHLIPTAINSMITANSALTCVHLASTMADDETLNMIALNCHDLTFLDISWCDNVTDLGLQKVGEGLKLLTALHCSGCRRVSNVGIEVVIRNCFALKKLRFFHCYRVTAQVLNFALEVNRISEVQVESTIVNRSVVNWPNYMIGLI